MEEAMLRPPSDVDHSAHAAQRIYGDPAWDHPGTLVELALRMWDAGMLAFVEDPVEWVLPFT
eukprot:2774769-Alexandrium_andersonii.AAC.1